jgi:hypothetical protein
MYTALLIKVNSEIDEVKILNGPHDFLGSTSIIGAFPDEDLVLLGSSTNTNTNANNSIFLKYFNKDTDYIFGDVLVVKTDVHGDPIDLLKSQITTYVC